MITIENLQTTLETIIRDAENKGFARGLLKGMKEGVNVVRLELAKILLEDKTMTVKEVAKMTQFSVKKIEELKQLSEL